MSDKVFIGPDVADLDYGEKKVISKVILTRSSDTWFEAGDDTGDTLECSNPWATQAMADAILAELQGSPAYLPYTAADALIDPAAEIGDGVTIGGIYSEIVSMNVQMDGTFSAGLAAPGVDEVEDEYPYQSSGDREAQRENKRIYSLITKTDQEIRLYVANEIEGLEAEFSITAGEIRSYVDDQITGVNSTISQTASSLTAQINSVDGRITSLSADLNGIEASVRGLEGDYSSLSSNWAKSSPRSLIWRAVFLPSARLSRGWKSQLADLRIPWMVWETALRQSADIASRLEKSPLNFWRLVTL